MRIAKFRKAARSAALATLGFAAAAIPLHLFLRRELRDAPEDLRSQGWPIKLLQVIFAKYIDQWIDVRGLENLPLGSYLVAANHGYKSGVDGFILGHLLATRGGRVPRIVMTAEHRSWVVRMERWVLYHYGIALLVRRRGLSDMMAQYLRAGSRNAVLIFPAGRADPEPARQMGGWSTGVVVAAAKSGCPIVPVAFGGLPLDWTPETLISAALKPEGPQPPFGIKVRIGAPVMATGEPHEDLERLRDAIAKLMSAPQVNPFAGKEST